MQSTGTKAIEVLLIEDDPQAATLFFERTRRFAPGEFGVTQARSLESGLDEVSHASFDLAVLDLTLPDSNGIETCTRFCEMAPDVPFIVLTGVVDGSLMETLSRAGAKAAIIKIDCAGQDLVNAMRTAHSVNEKERHMLPAAFKAAADARFRNAIIDNADGLVVIDQAGKVQLVSAGAESLLGRTASELQDSELGVALQLGRAVRAQVVREKPGHAEVSDAPGSVRQFDVCKLNISEIEFWAFSHQWSGKPVTVCAMRDVTNQVSEEYRQRTIVKIDQTLQVTAGLEAVCSDLAVRVGALIPFNRFEAAVWRPELNRLQIVFELGMDAKGRETGTILKRGAAPDGFGTWTTEWSSKELTPRIAISLGCAEPGKHEQRDSLVMARCASTVAAALRNSKAAPVFVTRDVTDFDFDPVFDGERLPEAA